MNLTPMGTAISAEFMHDSTSLIIAGNGRYNRKHKKQARENPDLP